MFIPGSSFSQIDIPKFTDVSAEAGLAQLTNTMSYAAAAADFNQDGFPDIAISTHGGITLLKNQGNGKFLDVSDILGFKEGDTHGISWIDINDDGLPDLAVSCGADRGRGEGANQFYLNRGGEKFEMLSSPDPIIADKFGRGRSITPADLNNDGAIDLIISNLYQPGRPHRIALALGRQHPLQFRDIAPPDSGIASLKSFGMIPADLNNDNHTYLIANGPGTESGSVFLQKENTFINVTQKIGLATDSILSVVPFDYDNDGDLDLLCIKRQFAGPSGAGLLNGKIYFDLSSHQRIQGFKSPIQADAIVANIRFEGRKRDPQLLHLGRNKVPATQLPWEGRSDAQILQGEPQLDPKQDAGGFLWRDSSGFLSYQFIGNRDTLQSTSGIIQSQSPGFTSLETINLAPPPLLLTNSLYQNVKGHFIDVADNAGILGNGLGYNAIAADFNNDGFMDIYVVNAGYKFEMPNPPNSLFCNNGNGTFSEVAHEAKAEGPPTGIGNGAIALDYDQDGDMDLFIYNGNGDRPMPPGPFTLLRNDSKNAKQSIQIDLQGSISNKRGWGVKILSVVGTNTVFQQKNGMNGHLSTSDLPTHIGLDAFGKADRITVIWPSGKVESLTEITAGSKLTIKERQR